MALNMGIEFDYVTVANALVYGYNTSMTAIGSFDSGVTLHFSEIKMVGSLMYGKINNSPAGFHSTGSPVAIPNGYYVNMMQVTPKTGGSTGGESGTTVVCTTKNNQKVTVTGISVASRPRTYYVKDHYSWDQYAGPDVSLYPRLGSATKEAGTAVSVYATVKSGGITWGATNTSLSQWGVLFNADGSLHAALDRSPTRSDTSSSGAMQTNADITSDGIVIDASEDTYVDMDDVMKQLNDLSGKMRFDDQASLQGLHNMQYVIGIPPKITKNADPRYMTGMSPANNFGRAYTEMFMMNNTLFSIQPCKVKYLPGFKEDQKNGFLEVAMSSITNAMDDADLASNAQAQGLNGQLFEAQSDYNNYINTVNMLARVTAIYLGIGDKKYMGTGPKYSAMDYSFYKIRGSKNESDGTIFGAVSATARNVADALVTSAINDDTYVHFYMTADGTSVNDSMSVSTRSSGMESLFNNGLSEIAQDIQFLFSGTGVVKVGQDLINSIGGGLSDMVSGVSADLGATLNSIVNYGASYLNGGRLVFPQMLDDCSYDRSYSATARFISPSGDIEAIFLNCYLPLCYLWPYVLPQMLSDNMYRYPYLAKVDASGLFHCDLAAITGMKIQRGGVDGASWTSDGLPFEIDVSFDVTPLYSKLMVTTARHPILFLSNSALHEYLGAMCGVTFTGDQIRMKLGIVKALFGNEIKDTVPSMLRGYYSSGVSNWLKKLFNF